LDMQSNVSHKFAKKTLTRIKSVISKYSHHLISQYDLCLFQNEIETAWTISTSVLVQYFTPIRNYSVFSEPWTFRACANVFIIGDKSHEILVNCRISCEANLSPVLAPVLQLWIFRKKKNHIYMLPSYYWLSNLEEFF